MNKSALRFCAVATVRSIDTRLDRQIGSYRLELQLELMRECDRDGMRFLMRLAYPSPGEYLGLVHAPPLTHIRQMWG